jgi:hypothetical protein
MNESEINLRTKYASIEKPIKATKKRAFEECDLAIFIELDFDRTINLLVIMVLVAFVPIN